MTSSVFTMNAIVIVLLLVSATGGSSSSNKFIQCFATSAQANGKIICPLGSTYCIKEVTNATRRADCGLVGKHSTDVWDRKLGQCVYRKCSRFCPSLEDDKLRDFNVTEADIGSPIRTSFCCNTTLCNAARSNSYSFLFVMTAVIFTMAVCF